MGYTSFFRLWVSFSEYVSASAFDTDRTVPDPPPSSAKSLLQLVFVYPCTSLTIVSHRLRCVLRSRRTLRSQHHSLCSYTCGPMYAWAMRRPNSTAIRTYDRELTHAHTKYVHMLREEIERERQRKESAANTNTHMKRRQNRFPPILSAHSYSGCSLFNARCWSNTVLVLSPPVDYDRLWSAVRFFNHRAPLSSFCIPTLLLLYEFTHSLINNTERNCKQVEKDLVHEHNRFGIEVTQSIGVWKRNSNHIEEDVNYAAILLNYRQKLWQRTVFVLFSSE